jgi:hypothetical protein
MGRVALVCSNLGPLGQDHAVLWLIGNSTVRDEDVEFSFFSFDFIALSR